MERLQIQVQKTLALHQHIKSAVAKTDIRKPVDD
jgi:hypothetical protein